MGPMPRGLLGPDLEEQPMSRIRFVMDFLTMFLSVNVGLQFLVYVTIVTVIAIEYLLEYTKFTECGDIILLNGLEHRQCMLTTPHLGLVRIQLPVL